MLTLLNKKKGVVSLIFYIDFIIYSFFGWLIA